MDHQLKSPGRIQPHISAVPRSSESASPLAQSPVAVQHLGNRRRVQMMQAKPQPRPWRLLQRFESDEHATLGDEGSRGEHGELRTVELAPDYRLSYGEMTAMAGDFFGSIAEMRSLANAKAVKGVGTREELEYVRLCKVRSHGDAAKEKAKGFSKEVIEAVDKRYYALALNNRSHFLNAAVGDENRSTSEKGGDVRRDQWGNAFPLKQENILDSAAGYHQHHVQALFEAYYAGTEGKGVDQAMAVEAFGSHYLTDSFSGGHVRTARASINEHWNKRVPMFNHNLKGFIAERLSKLLAPQMYGGILSVDAVYDWGALDTVTKKIDAKGTLTFGDVVSGAVHDYDNTKGVRVTVNGADARLFGDGHLGKGDEQKLAQNAVRLGMNDILAAWDAGKKKEDPVVLASRLLSGGVFAPEAMLPKVKPDSQVDPQDQRVKWDYDDVFALLNDAKFKEAITIFATEKAGEFEEVAKEMDDKQQQDAFMKGVVALLRTDPVGTIKTVINWVPDTGGGVGGHNQDDKALEYLEIAKKKGALGTLTVAQKVKIIRFVFDGYTSGDDEKALMEMINAKPSDVPALVKEIGWDNMEDELGSAFSKRYPKSMFSGK